MSSNSFCRILQTAPMVSAFRGRGSRWRPCCSETATPALLLQVTELVLADLDLVAVGEPVRLDPATVDVGAVERAAVVDVEAVAPPHQQGVVAGDGDVVEEDAGVGAAADADPVLVDREALAGAAAAGADHQRRAAALHRLGDA